MIFSLCELFSVLVICLVSAYIGALVDRRRIARELLRIGVQRSWDEPHELEAAVEDLTGYSYRIEEEPWKPWQ